MEEVEEDTSTWTRSYSQLNRDSQLELLGLVDPEQDPVVLLVTPSYLKSYLINIVVCSVISVCALLMAVLTLDTDITALPSTAQGALFLLWFPIAVVYFVVLYLVFHRKRYLAVTQSSLIWSRPLQQPLKVALSHVSSCAVSPVLSTVLVHVLDEVFSFRGLAKIDSNLVRVEIMSRRSTTRNDEVVDQILSDESEINFNEEQTIDAEDELLG